MYKNLVGKRMLNLSLLINNLNNTIQTVKSSVCITKFNSLCLNVLTVLQQLNIIESFLVASDFSTCTIFLNRSQNKFKLIGISKPNRYIYYSLNELIHLRSLDSYNEYIVSINVKKQTIINIDDAIRLHKGGLLLLKIFRN